MPTRAGSKRAFRYLDARGKQIRDEVFLERVEQLAIPPAWKDVWIAAGPRAKLQATGYDKAGRKQYLYNASYRAAQENAKYNRLILFGERLPDLRAAMSEHLDRDELDRERVSAVALRMISLGWFRVGSERYAREGTYGVTTLLRRHVEVRGRRIKLSFPSKAGIRVRCELVDEDLAAAVRGLQKVKGGARIFKYRWEGELYNLTSKRLNDYVEHSAGRGVHRQGLPNLGRHASRGDLLRGTGGQAGSSGLGKRAEAIDQLSHAASGGTARKYACRDARVVRFAGGRRAVPGWANDRRFSSTAFARRQGARYGPLARGTGRAQLASFLAYQERSPSCIARGAFL